MSKDDLTRWNRAGLKRFRYVDGNAATYLEDLRRDLHARFQDQWSALDVPVPRNEQPDERLTRLKDQYHGERGDYAWEISRSFSRATHVLLEHLNAYANEGYLRTASQWDNVRKLVAMLDYHPAPPASASTLLALIAKNGEQTTVRQGFQVKNAPSDGSAPAIFETLQDLEVDFELNTLKLKDWDRSPTPLPYVPCAEGHCTSFPVASLPEGLAEGTRGVLVMAGTGGYAVKLTAIDPAHGLLSLAGEGPDGVSLNPSRYDTRALLGPELIQSPRLMGAGVVRLAQGHGLAAGSAVAWQSGGAWTSARVEAVDGDRVALSTLPSAGAAVHRLSSAQRQDLEGSLRVLLPLERKTSTVWGSDLSDISAKVTAHRVGSRDVLDKVDDGAIHSAYYLEQGAEPVGQVVEAAIDRLDVSGDPGELASGDWVILATASGATARTIKAIDEGEDSYTLTLAGGLPTAPVTTLYGRFAHELRPADYDKNTTPVTGTTFALTDLPEGLEKGRTLLLAQGEHTWEVKVTAVNRDDHTIEVTPAVPCTGDDSAGTSGCWFTRHGTVIYGNGVKAGHGESKPEKILGSGNAAESGQRFVLDVEDVAFVADASMPSGVRAAIEVSVEGRIWQQVATLNNSEPTAHHYTVRMTEDGHLSIGFGDGRRGRRLPTGSNNVRVRYRVGTGPAGNVAAGELTKPVKPHPAVDRVVQPRAATGGNAMEAAEALRENAPGSVLTLERAVSLADFTHLASRNSQVWQARADAQPTGRGRQESIRVVVVPAGGGALGDLQDELSRYLREHSVPGVQVEVVPYRGVPLDLHITVRVDPEAFDLEEVASAVRTRLLSALRLERQRLGEPFYRSRLFELVEGIQGVANSDCAIAPSTIADHPVRYAVIGSDERIRRLQPDEDQVIYLDPETSTLVVAAQPLTL